MTNPFRDFFNRFRSKKKENETPKKIRSAEEILQSVLNRPIYKVLTEEIIDKTPDDELVQVVFDNLSTKFPKDYSKMYETVVSFSKGQQVIYAIWRLAAEVNNGGFNQYYFNSRGQYSKLTPDALRLVNADRFADLAERANKIFEVENEKIAKHQDGTLEGFSKSYEDNPLNDLDKEFYHLDQYDALDKLQIQFIRANKSEFID